jgi:Domain of unknown function (DUF4345)
MGPRVFLGLSALVWLPYGILCFLRPGFLAGAAGVAATTATGTIELRAMYGGLEAAIGLLAAGAVVNPSLRRPALLMLAFLCTGLGSARLIGVVLDGTLTAYTAFALVLELGSAALAAWLLARGVEARP